LTHVARLCLRLQASRRLNTPTMRCEHNSDNFVSGRKSFFVEYERWLGH